jgi:hypothetical protein
MRTRLRAGVAIGALLACATSAAARAEHPVNLHYSAELSSGYDSNLGNAAEGAGVAHSPFAGAGAHATWQRDLGLYTTLVARGSLQAEHYADAAGLDNGKVTGLVRLLHRPGGGFFTPTLAAWLSAAYWDFGSAIRDSDEFRAGVWASENLTTRLRGRLALAAVRREARTVVYDVDGLSAALDLDWRAAAPATLYAGYQIYDGDLVSSARRGAAPMGWSARAVEADDAFGGGANYLGAPRGLYAYRVEGRAGIATLGLNLSMSQRWAVDLQGQAIDAEGDRGGEYRRRIGVISLLGRW